MSEDVFLMMQALVNEIMSCLGKPTTQLGKVTARHHGWHWSKTCSATQHWVLPTQLHQQTAEKDRVTCKC